MTPPSRQCRPSRALMLWSVSTAALVAGIATPAAAQVAGLRAAAGLAPTAPPVITGVQNAVAPKAAGMASAAARALQNQARAQGAVSLATQANTAARDAARALAQTVPNGLGVGGLDPVRNGALASADPTGITIWQGASQPVQTGAAATPTVTITQSAERALLSWQTFNIGRDTTLVFDQKINGVAQPNWVVLNRVVGGLDPLTGRPDPSLAPAPSQILGSIKADGTVLVLNQNGVLFGATSQVNVRSLVASSLEIGAALRLTGDIDILSRPTSLSDRSASFLQNGLLAAQSGTILAGVTVQQGQNAVLPAAVEGSVSVAAGAQIASSGGGFVILAAPSVTNGGIISAPTGQVSLQSGRTIDARVSTGAATSIDPDVRGLVLNSPDARVEAGSAALIDSVVNGTSGIIDTPLGYASLGTSIRGTIRQDGAVTATTSVARNGKISLTGGTIRLGDGMLLSIRPDTGLETIPQSAESVAQFKTSKIVIGNRLVTIDANTNTLTSFDAPSSIAIGTDTPLDTAAFALIYAPNADVSIGARSGAGETIVPQTTDLASGLFVGPAVRIDVSGVKDAPVIDPALRNSVRIGPVKRNELRDTPSYREPADTLAAGAFTLNGQTVFVDPRRSGVRSDGVAWIGSPLIEAGSFIGQIGITAAELMTRGGNVILGARSAGDGAGAAAPSVTVRQGASIDFSGGWVNYAAGVIRTSRLLTASGRLVDIADADPNDDFVAVVNGFTEEQARFGFSQTFANAAVTGGMLEEAYTEGRDAGSLTVKASTNQLGGALYGDAFPGTQQIAASIAPTGTSSIYGDLRARQVLPQQLPTGGLLSIQALNALDSGTGADSAITRGGGDIVVYSAAGAAPARAAGQILIADSSVAAAGLAQLNLQTSGAVTLLPGTSLAIDAGGALSIRSGRTIRFGGDVTIPSGVISAETFDLGDGSIFTAADDRLISTDPLFDIVVDGTLSTRGRWVNDLLATDGVRQGAAYLDGGAVRLRVAPRVAVRLGDDAFATDLSGSILVNAGAAIDVSAGGYVDSIGILSLAARGGDVSLVNETTFFQADNLDVAIGEQAGLFGVGLPGFQVTPGNNLRSALSPARINARVSIAAGTIRGNGFSGGGTFTLVTPDLNFGAVAGASGTALPLDFIAQAGFSSYDITSWNTRIVPDVFVAGSVNALLGTEQVLIGAGQRLDLTQALLPSILTLDQADLLRGLTTGSRVTDLLSATVPVDAWDRRPVDLRFGGLTEVKILAGGLIEGSAGAALASATLLNAGTIRLPGGSVTQEARLPASFGAPGRQAIGVHDLAEVFGPRGDDGLFVESAPNAMGIGAPDGQGGTTIFTNAQLASGGGIGRIIYQLGDVDAAEGIRLAAGSVTDLSGVSIRNPRALVPSGGTEQAIEGRIVAGGALRASTALAVVGDDLFGDVAFGVDPYGLPQGRVGAGSIARQLMAEAGSRIDLAGAADAYTQRTQTGFVTAPVWSRGGSLSLGGGGRIDGALIEAAGGAVLAEGGTLEWLRPVLRQGAGAATTDVVSADAIMAAGFDSFTAWQRIDSIGDVALALDRNFVLTAQPFTGSTSANDYLATAGSGGALAIAAPYIRLESLRQATAPAIGTAAGNSLRLTAGTIDVAGSVVFERSIAAATLDATGDVRLIGVQPTDTALGVRGAATVNSLSGQLLTAGDLTIRAAQVYPTTGTGDLQQLIDAQRSGTDATVAAFLIGSTGENATIRFERSGTATPAAPYSAGGNLLVQAANIEQAGIVRVPVGRLTLGTNEAIDLGENGFPAIVPATRSVRLEAGGITSVSAGGLNIPYGTTTDLIEYFFAPTSSSRLAAPPSGDLRLAGNAIAIDAGATVDASGSGDVYAYEFASGTGGSRDVLSRFNSDQFSGNAGLQYVDGRQVYAIVPSLAGEGAAVYDPIYSADYADLYAASGAGRRVFLDAAPGIAAGWYTLLPARYALLPGGMRIVENVGDPAAAAGTSVIQRDGSIVATGRFGVAGTTIEESERRSFTVQSQETILKYSRIALTSANATFTNVATRDGLAIPRLPIDAARLVISPIDELRIATRLNTTPAAGGRGAQVDLTGQVIAIVAAGGLASPDTVTLGATDLANLNAASLLIGAVRTDRADGTTDLAVASRTITVANDAASVLSAAEVVLVTEGIGSAITIADGAQIVATGTVTDDRAGDYVVTSRISGAAPTGVGSIVRVANGPERLIRRTSAASLANSLEDATLTVGSARLDGDAVLLDSSRDLALAADIVLTSNALALGGDDFNFNASLTPPYLRGLVITSQLEQTLSGAQRLTIRTPSVVGFMAGTHDFADLRIDSRGIRLIRPDSAAPDATLGVVINARDVTLANSDINRGACFGEAQLACGSTDNTLELVATALHLATGPFRTFGFDGSVTLRARDAITYEGQASLDTGGADIALDAPIVGDRALVADPRGQGTPPSLALATTGNVAITNRSGAVAPAAIDGAPGARLLIGSSDAPVASIAISGSTLRATAGAIDMRATGGIGVAGGAILAIPGFDRAFGSESDQVRVAAPGGALTLVSLGGDISLGAGTNVTLGGPSGKDGSLTLSAGRGTLRLDGAITTGTAGSGSLTLDSGLASNDAASPLFNFARFIAANAAKFHGDLAVRTGQGDIILAAGQTLANSSVRLTADGGAVAIAGTIDTSNVSGGAIGLYGAGGVTLAGTARLDAHANGYAATDTRRATGGAVELGTRGDGAIVVAQGAAIDVGARRTGDRLVPQAGKDPVSLNDVTTYRYVEADGGGTVNFRAPVIEFANAPDSVAIRYAGTITGASDIGVEAYKTYDLAAIASGPAGAGFVGACLVGAGAGCGVGNAAAGAVVLDVNASAPGKVNFLSADAPGTIVDFVRNFDISAATPGLGALVASPVFHARPGVELDHSGDIILASNWNLGAGTITPAGIEQAIAAGLMARSPQLGGRPYVVPGREAELFARFVDLTYRQGGRATGEAGVLTLRAGGKLDIRGSITDGYYTFADQTDPAYTSYQLGGGDRAYRPAIAVTCGTATSTGNDCSVLGDYEQRGIPPLVTEAVNINLVSLTRGEDIAPGTFAPYSAAANGAGALGLGAGGVGDPIGSAALFPLLADGSAASSFSYRLVGGALPAGATPTTPLSADPLQIAASAVGGVSISGETNYIVQAERGAGRYGGTLQVLYDQNAPLDQSLVTNPADFVQGLNDFAGVASDNLYTRFAFGGAPAATRAFIQARARTFFTDPSQVEFFGPAGAPTLITAPLSRITAFLASIDAEFSGGIAAGTLGYAAPRVAALTALPNRNVFARSLVRTGTGSIAIAAAQDIDLRNGATPSYRTAANRDATRQTVAAAQIGGTAVYTAGHIVSPQTVSATVVGTGQTLQVDPAAYAIAVNYQAGTDFQPYLDGVLRTNPAYATGGGSVALAAGRSVLGRRDLWSETYLDSGTGHVGDRRIVGSADQRWRVGDIGGASTQSPATNIRVNSQLFTSGVGTLGGGDVTVRAGRDVSDLTVVADTSVTTADAGGALALMTFGGGDVTIAAARDLLGGRIDVASGVGSATAGGVVGAAGMVREDGQLIENLLRVRVSDAAVGIEAGGSVRLVGVDALGVNPLGVQLASGNGAGFYSPTSGLSIVANGAVAMTQAARNFTTPFIIGRALLNGEASEVNEEGVVLPGTLNVASINGGVDLAAGETNPKLLLYPSPLGDLTLFAGGDIASVTLAMDDGDPALLPGALTAFVQNGAGRVFGFPAIEPDTSDAVRRMLHNQRVTHLGDLDPVRIAAGGSINQVTLSLPKQARIAAGGDIIDMMFFGQNLAVNDVTRITAGRDITASTRVLTYADPAASLPALQGNNFVIGGPGAFFLEAGRDLGPFLNSAIVSDPAGVAYAGGITSIGNENNPWLGSAGARIYTSFGVAGGADYDALRRIYVDPAATASLNGDLFIQVADANGNLRPDRDRPVYGPILVSWLLENAPDALAAAFGRPISLTSADVLPLFQSLTAAQQRQFLAERAYLGEGGIPGAPALIDTSGTEAPVITTDAAALAAAAPGAIERLSGSLLVGWLVQNAPDVLATRFNITSGSLTTAYAALNTLPVLRQRQFLIDRVYFNELAQTARPGPSLNQFLRGYEATDAVFGAERGYTDNLASYDLTTRQRLLDANGGPVAAQRISTGNLDLRLATIETGRGGDIAILGPGGLVLGGSVVRTSEQAARRGYDGAGGRDVSLFLGSRRSAANVLGQARITGIPIGFEGVLTLRGGAVRGFTDGDFLLNQSRLFTQAGGDVTLWSSNGDLNAGQGPKTGANFPPIVLRFDPNGFSEVDSAGSVSGAGIAAFQPSPDIVAPSVTLIAPVGTVDAGDAGVRAAGNVFVAAAQVSNADNFKVGGKAFGVPGAGGVNVAASTSGDATSAAAAQAANAVNPTGDAANQQTRITVDVLGFAGEPGTDPCSKTGSARPTNCPPSGTQ